MVYGPEAILDHRPKNSRPINRPHPRFRETTVLRKPVGRERQRSRLDAKSKNGTARRVNQGRCPEEALARGPQTSVFRDKHELGVPC